MTSTPALTETHHERQELVIHADDNPRAVLNLLPPAFKSRVLEVMGTHPQFFNKPEAELVKMLKDQEWKADKSEECLRLRFWLEYDRVQTYGLKAISLTQICHGICTHHYFTHHYFREWQRVAWLLCVPTSYATGLEAMLTEGLRAMTDMMWEEHRDKSSGKIDHKIFDTKLKIFNIVAARKDNLRLPIDKPGTTVNVGVQVNSHEQAKIVVQGEASNMEVMEAKAKFLESEERRLAHQSSVTVVPDAVAIPLVAPEMPELNMQSFDDE